MHICPDLPTLRLDGCLSDRTLALVASIDNRTCLVLVSLPMFLTRWEKGVVRGAR
jgi:hypothetical protein